jgi:hypothetical protein
MGWGWVGPAISAVASLLQGQAAEDQADDQSDAVKKAAANNAKISLLDAAAAEKDAIAAETAYGWKLRRHMQQVDKLVGRARTGFAKSGVAMTGSALDTVVESARAGAEDAALIANEGKNAGERGREVAERYRLLAKYGLRDAAYQASLIEQAGADKATYQYLSGTAQAATDVYDYGQGKDWWD